MGFIGNCDSDMADLQSAWLQAILKHPGEYFSHRTESFLATIGVQHRDGQIRCEYKGPLGFPLGSIRPPSDMLNMWPYLIAFGLLLALHFGKGLRLNYMQLGLLSSGFMYGLSFALSSVSNSQRYSFWVVLSCSVLVVTIVLGKVKRFGPAKDETDEQ